MNFLLYRQFSNPLSFVIAFAAYAGLFAAPAAGQAPETLPEIDESDGEISSNILGPINTPGAVEQPPQVRVVHRERARWPRVAAKKRISGCVVYEIAIDGSGGVAMVRVIDASNDAFIQPGIDALYRSQFAPPRDAEKEDQEPAEDTGEDAAPDAPEDASDVEEGYWPTPVTFQIQLVWALRKTGLPPHSACDR